MSDVHPELQPSMLSLTDANLVVEGLVERIRAGDLRAFDKTWNLLPEQEQRVVAWALAQLAATGCVFVPLSEIEDDLTAQGLA